MTLAFDAFSNSGGLTTGNASWTHTPVGTPRGANVFGLNLPSSDSVGVATYGGVNMTEMTDSPHEMTTGSELDGIFLHAFHLGASIPTGAQTVVVPDNGGGLNKKAVAYTVTGAADTEETDTFFDSGTAANPSGTLSLGAVEAFCSQFGLSGQNAVTGITPFTDWTDDLEEDAGSVTRLAYSYDIVASTDVTVGFTQTSEQFGIVAAAINEIAAAGATSLIYQPEPMKVHLTQ